MSPADEPEIVSHDRSCRSVAAADQRPSGEFVSFPGSPFQLFQPYPPAGDQPAAIAQLVEGIADGLSLPDAAGRDRLGQDLHDGQRDRAAGPAGDRVRAEQDAGGAAVQRVPRVLPEERGRVLRQLLRLLPARGLRAAARPVHREGQRDQRAHRADAPVRHQEPARAARRDHRGQRQRDLRHRQPERLPPDGDDAARGRQDGPARRDRAADPHAVQAQRDRLLARHVPRARRHDRRLPGRAQRAGDAHRAVRRRDRVAAAVRPADRPHPAEDPALHGLPVEPLRDAARARAGGDRDHQGRAARAAGRARQGRQAGRGPAPGAAHPLRPRDAAGGRPLQGHRELHAPPVRGAAGRAAADAGRLPARATR